MLFENYAFDLFVWTRHYASTNHTNAEHLFWVLFVSHKSQRVDCFCKSQLVDCLAQIGDKRKVAFSRTQLRLSSSRIELGVNNFLITVQPEALPLSYRRRSASYDFCVKTKLSLEWASMLLVGLEWAGKKEYKYSASQKSKV